MSNSVDSIKNIINGFSVQRDVPLYELTSFRIGGPASYVWEVSDPDSLCKLTDLARLHKIPFVLLGRGTNVLADDKGYSGLLIRFDRPLHPPVFSGETVRACAGTSLTQLARETVENGLMGMECLCGIPGSVGGACAMNAGAYGAEIAQILKRVRVYENGTDRWMNVEAGMLGYRRSIFSFPDRIVLEAEFVLQPDDGFAKERMLDCLRRRKEKQPLEFPSAGSVFKRPEGYFAGALIEQCGLKGMRIGGAAVSEKHAGFIVNLGGATERDVTELIRTIQETVCREKHVQLECEIKRLEELQCTF